MNAAGQKDASAQAIGAHGDDIERAAFRPFCYFFAGEDKECALPATLWCDFGAGGLFYACRDHAAATEDVRADEWVRL